MPTMNWLLRDACCAQAGDDVERLVYVGAVRHDRGRLGASRPVGSACPPEISLISVRLRWRAAVTCIS